MHAVTDVGTWERALKRFKVGGPQSAQLALLSLALFASNYARTALNPFQEQVRRALSLTDSQIAILQGPALVLPLVLAAFPMGVLADKVSRARLVWVAVTLAWAGIALSAFARNYGELLVLRAVVGLATGAISIGVLSLVADHFEREVRGRANMVVALAEVGGASAAFAAGGFSADMFLQPSAGSWSHALLYMTIPMAAIAAVMSRLRDVPSTATSQPASSRSTIPNLWGLRAILLPLVAAKVLAVTAYISIVTWAAPALQRTFSVGPERASAVLSATLIVAGIGGPMSGGLLADLTQRTGGPMLTLKLLVLLAIIAVPASLFAILPSLAGAIVLMIVFATLVSMISVIEMTLTTILIPNAVRGLALSVMVTIGLLVGAGGAPLIVSELSIWLGGPQRLPLALSITCAISGGLGAASLAIGRRFLPRGTNT